jgi:mRNA deadenylase 3'-5' endonuclease subunit Ccr4
MNYTNKDISAVYDRDNVCIFAVLKHATSNVGFIVANCHLLFNINRGDVKIGQTYQIVETLNRLSELYSSSFDKLNFILCGDFNAIPNSGVYKLITDGLLDCTKIDKRKISNQKQGDLNYIDPAKLKGTLLNYGTCKYLEEKNSDFNVRFNIY